MTAEHKSPTEEGPLVLVVDDEPGFIRILTLVLEGDGYAVKTAASGEEALQVLRELVPALLILDVGLPGMSGYDVCQIIKRDARLQKIPVVFLTAHDNPRDYKTGYESGAVLYIAKPFNPAKLRQVVRMFAKGR